MRRELTAEALRELMAELARTAPSGERFRVYVVGGGTAVLSGWRASTIDADLCRVLLLPRVLVLAHFRPAVGAVDERLQLRRQRLTAVVARER